MGPTNGAPIGNSRLQSTVITDSFRNGGRGKFRWSHCRSSANKMVAFTDEEPEDRIRKRSMNIIISTLHFLSCQWPDSLYPALPMRKEGAQHRPEMGCDMTRNEGNNNKIVSLLPYHFQGNGYPPPVVAVGASNCSVTLCKLRHAPFHFVFSVNTNWGGKWQAGWLSSDCFSEAV